MRRLLLFIIGFAYQRLLKRIFFLQDPEKIHARVTKTGERLGRSVLAKKTISLVLGYREPIISQSLFGLQFLSPVGLAAGFDYEARLTEVLPSFGFGFTTVGTITNQPCAGNPRPILGRLPKSRALMVNKGFKNLGVLATLARLEKQRQFPVGLSLGRTNSAEINTQSRAIEDILRAFQTAQKNSEKFSHYELNISCPNLQSTAEFYEPEHLQNLLSAVGGLNLAKPVWIKMPISRTNKDILSMLEVVVRYHFVRAVILGNLQRDRRCPELNPVELEKFPQGNFSGAPCRQRSDELIRLAFQNFGSRLKIIGCGGIFSAQDAYRKIKLGASLVQLITGLVFEGPQLTAAINKGLADGLRRDGYCSVTEAVGREVDGN